MSQQNVNVDRERETAQARAELLRLAEEQGVRPLSFDEMLGGDFWNKEDERDESFDQWLRRTRAEGDQREAG